MNVRIGVVSLAALALISVAWAIGSLTRTGSSDVGGEAALLNPSSGERPGPAPGERVAEPSLTSAEQAQLQASRLEAIRRAREALALAEGDWSEQIAELDEAERFLRIRQQMRTSSKRPVNP